MSYYLGNILLAGGQSARYAGNKLLSTHPFANTPLVAYSAEQLIQATTECRASLHHGITVVSGNWDESIRHALSHLPVSIVTNTDWHEGIAASIREGVGYLVANKLRVDMKYKHGLPFNQREGVLSHLLITLADLPKITSYDLRKLIEASKVNPSNVVCSEWQSENKTLLTVPAIFPAEAFNGLLNLSGDVGAKPVIRQFKKAGRVTAVPIPNAKFDIDTPDDWTSLY